MSIDFWNELDLILRLLAGTAVGVIVGWERTIKQSMAGIRTFGLVGLGTATAAAVFAGPDQVDASSRVIQGVLTGDAQALVVSALAGGAQIKAGKLKPLAIAGDKRSVSLPDVPTFKELGYPDIQLGFWQALVAPNGTPNEIVEKIAADVRTLMNSEDFRKRYVEPFEYTVIGDTPAEFRAFYAQSLPKAEKRVKDSGAKLEKQ